ncbi:uncharacterized protein LOC106663558 [Cimex lectularius]|uniref:Uncharacterized protein n=1 Tax=Cimex lectularius TaxID=79782 RepID=A0A8I6RFL7_CIMLE|nr:uncharacterized protein LOC106663558 [Cimex lectularius]
MQARSTRKSLTKTRKSKNLQFLPYARRNSEAITDFMIVTLRIRTEDKILSRKRFVVVEKKKIRTSDGPTFFDQEEDVGRYGLPHEMLQLQVEDKEIRLGDDIHPEEAKFPRFQKIPPARPTKENRELTMEAVAKTVNISTFSDCLHNTC